MNGSISNFSMRGSPNFEYEASESLSLSNPLEWCELQIRAKAGDRVSPLVLLAVISAFLFGVLRIAHFAKFTSSLPCTMIERNPSTSLDVIACSRDAQ
jgi:hypothetical protein